MEIGSLLKDRYRISSILGKGGMGAVYRAFDETLGVLVALKENLFQEEEYVQQFRREATILANLRHPNLPRVTDHFVIEGQGQYLVMDFIDGEDLKERIDRLGVLAVSEAAAIGAEICTALEYLHSRPQPILHRDIKPGNVKISPKGEIFLVDFGLAKIVSGSGHTATGAQGITPGFSSPEQYGATPTTPLSDIYSLAATLYEALGGVPPENALKRMMDEHALTDIRERNPQVPEDMAAVLERALEIQPEDRYQSASEFRQALLAFGESHQQLAASDISDGPRSLGEATAVMRANHGQEASLPEKPGRGMNIKVLTPVAALVILGMLLWLGLPLLNPSRTVTATMTMEEGTVTVPIPTDSSQAPGRGVGDATPAAAVTDNPEKLTPTVTAIPAPTAIGGGSGEIAFASDRSGTAQVWVVRADGSGLRQVTDMDDGACQPDWSPDGKRIVFVSPCARNQDTYPGSSLFLINADGSGLSPLPPFPGGDFDPAFSPDGEKIAFTSLRNGGRQQIWVIDLRSFETTNLSNSVAKDFQPAWSPDGELIMFVTTRTGSEQLWFMDQTGRPWDFFTRSESFNNRDPVWSPNRNIIIFTQSNVSGGGAWLSSSLWEEGEALRGFNEAIIIHDANTRTRNPMREADFSPDGNWLVVVNNLNNSNREIFILSIEGENILQITDDPGSDFDPDWNPAK